MTVSLTKGEDMKLKIKRERHGFMNNPLWIATKIYADNSVDEFAAVELRDLITLIKENQ
jgi:hypothetical protein